MLVTRIVALPHDCGVHVTLAEPSAPAATVCSSAQSRLYRYWATPGRAGRKVNVTGRPTTPSWSGLQLTSGPFQTSKVSVVAGVRPPSASSPTTVSVFAPAWSGVNARKAYGFPPVMTVCSAPPLKTYAKPARLGSQLVSCTSRSEERRVGKECRSRWGPYQ